MVSALSNLRWRSKFFKTSLSHVPSEPGLYAFGRQKFCYGLEAKREYVYIGQTVDLRRRLSEHTQSRETNKNLQEFFRNFYHDVRCWYCPLSEFEINEIKSLETELIQYFKPKFNIQKNK